MPPSAGQSVQREPVAEPVSLRQATASDNAALLRLFSDSGMAARFSLTTLRDPDYFALSRLQGESVRVGVAEAPGAGVVGCVAMARRTVWLGGSPSPAAYGHDLRVLPGHRGRGIGDGLLAWANVCAEELVGANGVAFGATLVGNRAIERRKEGIRGLPAFQDAAWMRVYTIFAAGLRRASRPDPKVRLAEPGDCAAFAQLWTEIAPARELAPVMGLDRFAHVMQRWPGLGTGSFLVIEERGEPAAFLALWDQRGLRTIRVDSYPAPVGVIRAAYNVFRLLHRGARLPAIGEVLNAPAILFPCVPPDRPDLLQALLGAAADQCSALRLPAFTIALDRTDPLSAALSGIPAVATDFRVYLTSPAGRYAGPALRPGHPVHFEHALV